MKLYRLISVILACALALSLCACTNSGRGNDLPDDDTVELGDTTDTPDTADTPTTGFKILTDPSIPSEEEIMRIFEHASSIWNVIHISSLEGVYGDNNSNMLVYDGNVYFPVRDYETKADLEARFRECFSKQLTEHKLEHMFQMQYREIDGRLYVMPADRGTDIRAGRSNIEYEIIDETTISVARFIDVCEYATVEHYDNMWYKAALAVQEMMLIYEDGRWVFDNFYVCDDISNYALVYDYAKNIATTFIKAEALAAHFTGHASAYVGDNDSFEVTDENGFTQKYEHYGLANSLSELRSLLEAVFTPKLADKFMNTKVSGLPLFTERDGKLYKFGGYMGLYSYDDVHREIIGYTEGIDKIDITVHLRKNFDGDTVYANQTYTAVLGEDGKYRFDGDFTLPIQIAVNMVSNG